MKNIYKRRFKMKYCCKCGNELFDEAVICPKCGCPTEGEIKKDNASVKVNTAAILNNIAFIINLLISIYAIYSVYFEKAGSSEAKMSVTLSMDADPNSFFFWLWIIFNFVTFAIGLMIKKRFNSLSGKLLPYIYLLSSILSVIFMIIGTPNILILLVCAIGVVFFVPAILQVIATINFLQGTK